MHDWKIYPDAKAVAQAAAEHLAGRIRALLADKDNCHIALPGGTTPAACLRLLAGMDLPWARIHWYLGDERCLPVGDAERNDTMIGACLWSAADIPAANCHPIPAELGPDAGAVAYGRTIEAIAPLDIVLLGMGEDGHTASLFPGNPALELTETAVPVFDSPKPPSERVSLSARTLRASGERIVLITGAGKRDAVEQLRAGVPLPINQVGTLLCLADEAASA